VEETGLPRENRRVVANQYIPKVNLFPLLRFAPCDVFRVQQCTDQNQMVREGIQKYIDEHIATLNEDDARDFIDAYLLEIKHHKLISGIHRFRESSYLLSELRKMVWFIVCNGTFNNISVETLATLGKQENGTQTKTHTQHQENIK
jgi:hypothetical protein